MKVKENMVEFLSILDSQIKSDQELHDSISSIDLNIDELKEDILQREIIVPIIGPFSAGKSSLINSFLETDYLPVGITPETSLATEIRYSENERIECIMSDNSDKPDIYSLSDFEKIKEKANAYEYMVVYLNNPNLKRIQPAVLVDMPGFESPVDIHNKAILNYLGKGIFYVVVISVESGTLPRSFLNRLKGLESLQRDFEVILNKVNLKSEKDVLAIKEKIEEDIKTYLNFDKEVHLVGENGGKILEKILTSLNTDELIKKMYLPDLKYKTFQVVDTIETIISSMQKTVEQNDKEIKALEKEIESLIKEKDKKIREIESKHSSTNVNRILSSIEREMIAQKDYLANIAVSSPDKFSKIVNDMVVNVLSVDVPNIISDIGSEIIDDVGVHLKSIQNSSDLGVNIPTNWISEKATQLKDNLLFSITNKLEQYKNTARAAAVILAVTTNFIAPVLELIIIALPDIVNKLLSSSIEQKQKEKAKSIIMTQIIPSLKAELRPKLLEIVNNEIKKLTTNVINEYENMLRLKKDSIEQAQKNLKEKAEEISVKISKYQNIKKNIVDSYNKYLS
ncbi:dynamin family protein [Calditerrivibrio nitroreducens]|uniref:Dynamin N-terminal domain-containing protein n=1 Tax=Calditerrivibrio nitroreducens (strain DSM 19672 / NBRC 101217 / Yu37-1) TaxID=768670 RepID=E4TK94_CALNY|nr:dynamin family protein [Calditerrivibrio nitroreducens]ADR19966.1 hypothetical protein Calni_2074 [Calditerrivibrio nitroreducens DSM 19672]